MSREDVAESARCAYAALADLAHAWQASMARDDDGTDVALRIARTLAATRDLEMQAEMVLDDRRGGAEVRQ